VDGRGERRVVGDAVRAQRVGEPRAELAERAGEDGDLAERGALEAQACDLARDPVRLLGDLAERPAGQRRVALLRGLELLVAVRLDVQSDDG